MLKTMALKITLDSYPIAAALLPAGFLKVNERYVLDCYVIINDVAIDMYHPGTADQKQVTLQNLWMVAEEFRENFVKVTPGREPQGAFFEVRRVNN